MQQLKKKYGLFTAICMVVGIVIGSGIFFKTQDVLDITGGNALTGVFAWLIGGAIMVVMASTFAQMATKYEKVNGVVDYAEAVVGPRYAYYVGWFVCTVYYPAMTSVLAWVSARYTMVAVFGHASNSPEALFSAECICIAAFYLITIFFINAVAPKLSGHFQVSTTIIKLVPIVFIALVGTVIGLFNGNLAFNLSSSGVVDPTVGFGKGLFAALCCTAFAYEGWIIATSINSEIKDAKKNLPLALCIGSAVVVVAYVLYYIGVLGLCDTDTLMQNGTSSAFEFFGKGVATVINFLIIVSCLGTLNGLTMGCARGFYSLAARRDGLRPEVYSQIDKKTDVPYNSAILGLFFCILWFMYFIGGQFFGWFGKYAFDSSELPIITIYPLYVPIIICFMIKGRDFSPLQRFVLPALSVVGSGIMVVASIYRHGIANVWYLIVFALFMLMGVAFERKDGFTNAQRIFVKLTGKPLAQAATEADISEE